MSMVAWNEMKLPLVPGAAIVTGGASGIGRAVVEAFAQQGAPVAVVDRMRNEADAGLRARVQSGRALLLDRDVGDFAGAESAVRETEAALGPVGALVACAGIHRDAASWKMAEEDWRAVLDTDLTGCFTYARAVAAGMRERGRGRIVFVTSINGLRGKFGQANYTAAKAGLLGLAKTLARELGPKNITVNAVAPGMIRTPMTASLGPEVVQKALSESVLGRLGDPEDVAGTILFLCSTLARHVTGTVVRVDGGQAL